MENSVFYVNIFWLTMATYGKRLNKLGCDPERLWRTHKALAIHQCQPYNTERNYLLLKRTASLMGLQVVVDYLEGNAVPLNRLDDGGKSLVNKYPESISKHLEIVSVIPSLKLIVDDINEICGVNWILEVYESKAGVKVRIRGESSQMSRQDHSSCGAIVCHNLDEIKKEIENWVGNRGGVMRLYHARQLVYINMYAHELELPKCEGELNDLGLCRLLDLDNLEKAKSAYSDYCIKNGECKTVQRICVNEKWCRSNNVKYDYVCEGDLDECIQREASKIYREWNSKFGVVGGMRVVFNGPYKDEFPVKVVRYELELSPIIKYW